MTNYIDRPTLRYPTARTPSAPSEATDEWSNEPKSATNSSNAATTASSSTPTPRRSRSSGPWPKSAALRSTLTDDPVGRWAANKVESAYVPVYGSWLNRIEPQFTAGATPPSTAPATTAPREGQDDPPPHRLAEPARHRSPHPQDLWRASQIPDTGPNKVRPGTEDDQCENGVESSRLSSRTRP